MANEQSNCSPSKSMSNFYKTRMDRSQSFRLNCYPDLSLAMSAMAPSLMHYIKHWKINKRKTNKEPKKNLKRSHLFSINGEKNWRKNKHEFTLSNRLNWSDWISPKLLYFCAAIEYYWYQMVADSFWMSVHFHCMQKFHQFDWNTRLLYCPQPAHNHSSYKHKNHKYHISPAKSMRIKSQFSSQTSCAFCKTIEQNTFFNNKIIWKNWKILWFFLQKYRLKCQNSFYVGISAVTNKLLELCWFFSLVS